MVSFLFFFGRLTVRWGKNLEIVSAFVSGQKSFIWSFVITRFFRAMQILHPVVFLGSFFQSRYLFLSFQSLISRLPAYISIQFVRFYYKEKEKINAKILKVRNNVFYVLFSQCG